MKYILLIFFLISNVDAQAFLLYDTAKIKKIGMAEGLSLNSSLCIIQDHQGIIWIGTSDGLNKYNGVDNLVYKYNFDDSLSLSNNQINCIFEDSRNTIWVGTANGLNVLNPNNTFRKYVADSTSKSISHRYVKCIAEDKKGNIWVGTSEGLNIYDPRNATIEKLRLRDFSSNTNNIISLYKDRNDTMWVCTRGGLFFLDKTGKFERLFLSPEIEENKDQFEIRDILQDSNGTYWVATENNGIFSFVLKNGNVTQVSNFNTSNSSIISNHVRKIKIINNQIWCATLDGVCTIQPQKKVIEYVKWEGLSDGSFHDIMEDKDGGIWIASYLAGVIYYHHQNNLFPHIKESQYNSKGLNDNSVTGFLDDGEKGYWISTGNGGLNYFNAINHSFDYYTKEQNSLLNNIKAMDYDKKKNIWIGTFNGLVYFDRRSNSFQNFIHQQTNENSLVHNQVHAVHVDDKGIVWIGTNGGGVQTYNPMDQSFSTIATNFFNIRNLFEDKKGRIWIGSNGALECVDKHSRNLVDLSSLTRQYANKLVYINVIYEDKIGRIVIGTQYNGLFIIDDNEIFWYNKNNGLLTNTVNAIQESNTGTYWISSNNGLSKIKFVENLNSQKEVTPINFNVSHGLQSLQFEPNCSMRTADGMLYFGGINGFNYFMPDDIEKLDFQPSVVLSELVITDENYTNQSFIYPIHNLSVDSTINLEYNQRNLLLKFSGVNYTNPRELFYRYKLGNNDESWIDLQNQRSINITYLPIGKHELFLQSSSNPNFWGNTYSTIKFNVLPPFWKTWWAFTIYFFVLALLLYLYFTFSLRWAKLKSNLDMEHFQREKEHELHESKLRFFTDISHELRTPLTLILAPVENIINQTKVNDRFKNQLLMIQKNGSRMTQLINQLLDLRKLETGNDRLQVAQGNIVVFIKEICLAFDGIAESKNITLKFASSEPTIPIWFDRDKIEIVFYNLISNAFKYTPAGGGVHLEIKTVGTDELPATIFSKATEGGVKITITDTGQGISNEDMEKIFNRFFSKKSNIDNHQTGIGLELAKRMIQLHNGHIFVRSQVETNEHTGFTSFVIFLLLGKNHFTEQDIIPNFKNSEDISQYTKDFILRERQIESTYEKEIDAPESNPEKKTILVVEDNTDVRKFIVELLSNEYAVIEAENGKIGLEMAINIGPDLIISDVMMPEMNGIELCKKIKLDNRISHTPVILLTARTAITFKYEGYETGADEYITKPFSASYLKLRIRNLLKQKDILQRHFKTEAILEPGELSVTSVDEKLLKKAIDYITKNIATTDITVNELSNELGLSRVHFYRKIKALTNMTAVEFIRSIRLRMACRLLEQGKFNIKEVKNLVGFESADYFRKCFKETYNLTPSEYAAKYHNHPLDSNVE